MKSSPTRRSRVFSISLPEDMAKQVEAIAKKESRTISEVFREALRALRMQRLDRILESARAEARARGPIPYREDDVEVLVDEIRAERYKKEQRKKTA